MPTPFRARLLAMTQLHHMTLTADAAEMAEKAWEESGRSVVEACRLIADQHPTEAPLLSTLKQRITVLLALDALLSFAPETRTLLEAVEQAEAATKQ